MVLGQEWQQKQAAPSFLIEEKRGERSSLLKLVFYQKKHSQLFAKPIHNKKEIFFSCGNS